MWPKNSREASVAGAGGGRGRRDGDEGQDATGGLILWDFVVLCGFMGLWVDSEENAGPLGDFQYVFKQLLWLFRCVEKGL